MLRYVHQALRSRSLPVCKWKNRVGYGSDVRLKERGKYPSVPYNAESEPGHLKRKCHKILKHFFYFINPTHLGP